MGIISIKNLVHRFSKYGDNGEEIGEKTALEQVSLDIEKGSFVAILGHNGSGKSTLAKHLNALLLPTEGTVYISDKLSSDEKNLWKIRQSTGMVFQNPDNQIVANVVEEDVGFGPENMGVPTEEIWKRVNESLKAVGMEAYRMQSPNKLSGGQKQRVAIAGIMAMKPQIIVMDEPTAMLDPSGRKEVLDTVHELNKKEKITVILITHYMEEVIDADRVVVVDGGRIVDDGTPREIFSQVEQLKRYHLDVPQVTELAWELKKDGLPFKDGVLSVNEFTDEFKRVCDADFSVHGAQVSGKENYSENNYSKTMNSDPEQVLLQLSHVTHVYDPDSKESFPALNDVSLSIHKNEFIGIIGHTGSGKSTLIQHLNGLMKPTSGTITYDGKDIWQDGYPLKELRSKVGLVFQYPEYQLFEESVFKDVCFGPKNQGLIEDEVKEDAAFAIRELKQSGIRKTVMLTGDAKAVGENVAQRLGLDEVYTELLPADKVSHMEQLLFQTSGKGKLAFVGDGINDAPVLARADIGIAMGGLGSDAAIEAADVVIMTDEPSKIAAAMRISRKTLRIVRQNIVFALGIKAIVLVLGAAGFASMWAAVFADAGVSVIAILNAVRALQVAKDDRVRDRKVFQKAAEV